jgi:hypothetical protein
VIPERHRERVVRNLGRPPLLIDGEVRGWWKVTRSRGDAALEVELFEPLPRSELDPVERQGLELLSFAAPDAKHVEVQVIPGIQG